VLSVPAATPSTTRDTQTEECNCSLFIAFRSYAWDCSRSMRRLVGVVGRPEFAAFLTKDATGEGYRREAFSSGLSASRGI
jgi:hypothetical protein